MTARIIKVINTKPYADGDSVQTTLTIDFTGLTPEDIMEVAAQAAVVKYQSNIRKAKVIPTVDTYKVPRPGTRSAQPVTAEGLIAKYGSKEAAIEALMAVQ